MNVKTRVLRIESLELREMLNAAPFETFNLHSKPDSHYTIYLDFNGHTTVDKLWNKDCTDGAPIITPAFSMDSDVNRFSDSELERIRFIWERVAEDFAPFDVDVTTEEPPSDRLIKSRGGDTDWGIRVVIGGNSSWYGYGGGVAYIDSFDMDSDTPCFIFSQDLGNEEKRVAEAISHEVGHTLGLYHDGTVNPPNSYYSGANGWAPIMGTGYYQSMTQWSKGEYENANNKEDDLAIITRHIPYKSDDHGNLIADATELKISDGAAYQTGLIERNTDYDFFSFTITSRSSVNLNMVSEVREVNLDIKATLYNSNGTVLTVSNPDHSLWASISEDLAAGTYFVSITGDGKPGVYSDYGSLGSYAIYATITELLTLEPVGPLELLETTSITATLAWNKASNASFYTIERSFDGQNDWTNVGTSIEPWFTDINLSRGKDYYYRVISANATDETKPSPSLKVRTGELPIAVIDNADALFVQEGCVVQISASNSCDPDSEGLRYFWDINETGVFVESTESVWFSAAALDGKPGVSQTVRLKVAIPDGTESEVIETKISIEDVPPMLSITEPSANGFFVGTLARWTIRATDILADHIQHWSVDWGDGTTSEQPGNLIGQTVFTHMYTSPGTFTIKITVTDDDFIEYAYNLSADVLSLQITLPRPPVDEPIETPIAQVQTAMEYDVPVSWTVKEKTVSLAEHDYYYKKRNSEFTQEIWNEEFAADLFFHISEKGV